MGITTLSGYTSCVILNHWCQLRLTVGFYFRKPQLAPVSFSFHMPCSSLSRLTILSVVNGTACHSEPRTAAPANPRSLTSWIFSADTPPRAYMGLWNRPSLWALQRVSLVNPAVYPRFDMLSNIGLRKT